MAPGVDLLHIVSRRFRTARTNLIVISLFVFWVGIVDLRRFAGTGHGMLLYHPRSTHHPRVCSLLVVRDRTGNLRLLRAGFGSVYADAAYQYPATRIFMTRLRTG